MKLVLLSINSAKEPWSDLATALYKNKISHFFDIEIIHPKISKSSRDNSSVKIKEDSETVLKHITKDDFVVLFDERGKTFNSIQFSEKLEQMLNSGKKRIVFVIGGAYGVSDEVRTKANLMISFSPMVFNHLVAELVALEQLYRGLTILRNIPYHNI